MIHKVHHIQFSYGWVIFSFLRKSLGVFPWFANWRGKRHILKIVDRNDYHDCTATGVY